MPQSSSASFSQGKSTLAPEHDLPVLNSQPSSPRRPSGLSKIRWDANHLICSSSLLIVDYWCISEIMREPMAEFAGVAVFLIIGTGVDCQVVLSTDPAIASSQRGVSRVSRERRHVLSLFFKSFLSVNFGWALGLTLGVWVSGGISGGHVNPAVFLFYFSVESFFLTLK